VKVCKHPGRGAAEAEQRRRENSAGGAIAEEAFPGEKVTVTEAESAAESAIERIQSCWS